MRSRSSSSIVRQRAPVDAAGRPTSQNASKRRRRMRAPARAAGAHASPRAPRRGARGSRRDGAPGGAATARVRTAAARPPRASAVDVRDQPLRRAVAPADEQRAAPRRAGGGRGSGRGRRGTATGSGPSARRPTDARGAARRRPQWRSPNSESSCSTSSSGESSAAQRPDRDRVAGRGLAARPRGSGTGCRAGSGCRRAGRRACVRRMLPGGRSCLIRRFSSTSAPSSDRVAW